MRVKNQHVPLKIPNNFDFFFSEVNSSRALQTRLRSVHSNSPSSDAALDKQPLSTALMEILDKHKGSAYPSVSNYQVYCNPGQGFEQTYSASSNVQWTNQGTVMGQKTHHPVAAMKKMLQNKQPVQQHQTDQQQQFQQQLQQHSSGQQMTHQCNSPNFASSKQEGQKHLPCRYQNVNQILSCDQGQNLKSSTGGSMVKSDAVLSTCSMSSDVHVQNLPRPNIGIPMMYSKDNPSIVLSEPKTKLISLPSSMTGASTNPPKVISQSNSQLHLPPSTSVEDVESDLRLETTLPEDDSDKNQAESSSITTPPYPGPWRNQDEGSCETSDCVLDPISGLFIPHEYSTESPVNTGTSTNNTTGTDNVMADVSSQRDNDLMAGLNLSDMNLDSNLSGVIISEPNVSGAACLLTKTNDTSKEDNASSNETSVAINAAITKERLVSAHLSENTPTTVLVGLSRTSSSDIKATSNGTSGNISTYVTATCDASDSTVTTRSPRVSMVESNEKFCYSPFFLFFAGM